MCVALVICDDVIEDRRTGNKSLIGLFNNISTVNLPAVHPRMFLVASLTSGRGAWPFSFRVAAPSGREILRMQDTVEFTNPLAVHDLVVEVRSLPIEEEGVYFVDLLVGETPTANRRFTVQIAPEGAPPA
jgi:hypothetical protein